MSFCFRYSKFTTATPSTPDEIYEDVESIVFPADHQQGSRGSSAEDQHKEQEKRQSSQGDADDIYGSMDTYGILETLPKQRQAMTVSEVLYMLKALRITHAIEQFQEETIDGEMLSTLTDDMLKENFSFSNYHITKMRKFLSGWTPSHN